MSKVKLNMFMWNFSFYRMLIKKINFKKLNMILNDDKWILIDLNKVTDKKVKELLNDKNLLDLKNKNRFVFFLNSNDFINWFNQNKNSNNKYLFINKLFHCKYQYRFVRFNGFKSYLIKNKIK